MIAFMHDYIYIYGGSGSLSCKRAFRLSLSLSPVAGVNPHPAPFLHWERQPPHSLSRYPSETTTHSSVLYPAAPVEYHRRLRLPFLSAFASPFASRLVRSSIRTASVSILFSPVFSLLPLVLHDSANSFSLSLLAGYVSN